MVTILISKPFMIRRLFREPLVHFVLLGAVLYAASFFMPGNNMPAPGEKEIVISPGKIEHLAALFARTWQRPPTREELEGIVNDFIREEAAYREGLALGLDRDDTIIRRRLRQKLDFIAEDLASQAEPGDEALGAYLAEHAEAFRIAPRLTFRQIYLNPEKRGDGLAADAGKLLDLLNSDPAADATELGDRILLDPGYADISERDIARLFGQAFAAAVAELAPGAWRGPVRSGYGMHLVKVDERLDGRIPELDEVREAVRREWENSRREKTIEQFYSNILKRYDITIEWPQAALTGADS